MSRVEGDGVGCGQTSAAPHPLRSPSRWRVELGRRLVLLDAIAIVLANVLAYWGRSALGETGLIGSLQDEVPTALAVGPLWLLILYWMGAYRPEYLNTGGDAFRRFAAGVVVGVFALGFVSFALQLDLSRLYVLFLFVSVLVGGGVVRIGVRRYLFARHRRGELLQKVLLAGVDAESIDLAQALVRHEASGYRVAGFLDDTRRIGSSPVPGVAVLGRIDEVVEVASREAAGLVIASPTAVAPGTLRDVRVRLEGSAIDLAVAPSLVEVLPRRLTIETVANTPILHVDQVRLAGGRAATKRAVDIVIATVLSVLCLPLVAGAVVMIRAQDGSNAVFRQQRIGRDGRAFTILKFRTMVPDAETRLTDVEHLNEAGHAFFKLRDDPRVTRLGAFLRKWSIDEIPQLWNVLRGDMSMVGPRPPLPSEVEKYEPWQLRRLRVRPGITGVWQVSGRSNVPFDEAVRLDLFYIENWSLGYDLFLLGKTVLAVLGRRGAY